MAFLYFFCPTFNLLLLVHCTLYCSFIWHCQNRIFFYKIFGEIFLWGVLCKSIADEYCFYFWIRFTWTLIPSAVCNKWKMTMYLSCGYNCSNGNTVIVLAAAHSRQDHMLASALTQDRIVCWLVHTHKNRTICWLVHMQDGTICWVMHTHKMVLHVAKLKDMINLPVSYLATCVTYFTVGYITRFFCSSSSVAQSSNVIGRKNVAECCKLHRNMRLEVDRSGASWNKL
jgi:hypothetical protein